MDKKLRILILEDVPADAELMERELRKGGMKFSSKRVETRKAFLKELKDFEPNLILGDYKLPSFDGLSALEIVLEKCPEVPFIFVSGAIGEDLAIETIKRGARDYVLKDRLSRLVPTVNRALREVEERTKRKQAEEEVRESETRFRILFEAIPDPVLVHNDEGTILHINEIGAQQLEWSSKDLLGRNLRELVTPEQRDLIADHIRETHKAGWCRFETTYVSRTGWQITTEVNARPIKFGKEKAILSVARDITERKRAEVELQRSYRQVSKMLITTVNALAATIAMRDPYTAGHQRRVTELACVIAEEMGLSEKQIEGLRLAATVHDIGKIIVPAEILNKPGRLNDIEFDIIKTHPQAAYDILKSVEFSGPVAQIVQQHHERMDGSGYPQGLSGEDILLEARILAVADVVEAMSSHRPYRAAHGIKKTLEEISQNRGVLYDPDVVDACVRLFAEKGFNLE